MPKKYNISKLTIRGNVDPPPYFSNAPAQGARIIPRTLNRWRYTTHSVSPILYLVFTELPFDQFFLLFKLL